MRQAYVNKQWIKSESTGEFVGVCMGSDFCAEHEFGIDTIKNDFGIVTSEKNNFLLGLVKKEIPIFGIECRRIRRVPEHFQLFDKDGFHGVASYSGRNKQWVSHLFDDGVNKMKTSAYEFSSYWDEKSFLLVTKPDDHDRFDDIVRSIREMDAAIFIGGAGAFSNGGLNIVIISKMQQDVRDAMSKLDESKYRLKATAEATGIHEEAKRAGKAYFALSPGWKDKSEKEIHFWLNPYEQDKYNAGWYSLTELRQWFKNEGPIIKEDKNKQLKINS